MVQSVLTNGGRGKLAGSVSCGIVANASTQWPFEGLGRIFCVFLFSTAWPWIDTAAPTRNTASLEKNIFFSIVSQ